MFEELIPPLKESLELNSYLNIKESEIKIKYGDEILNLIKKLVDDFYKTNAADEYSDIKMKSDKAKKDFLLKYPDVNTEVLNILCSDYLYNTYW